MKQNKLQQAINHLKETAIDWEQSERQTDKDFYEMYAGLIIDDYPEHRDGLYKRWEAMKR